MNELTPQKEQSEKPKNEKWLTPYGRFMFRLLDGISIVFWSYVVIKLLFFDFDVLLVDYFFPGHTWLLNLKFFALIGALAISLIFADKGVVLFWCGYILLFPATLLLWKIPRFVLKRRRWVLGFAFVNAIISFFSAFKYNVLMAAALLISSAAILFGANKNVVWAAIILAVAILYIGYAHRFWAAIRPSDTFRLHTKIVSGVSKFATSSFALDDKIRGVPYSSLDSQQAQNWQTSLQLSILLSRSCLVVGRKLKEYQTSGVAVVSASFVVLFLFAITVAIFAIANFGLYKIDHRLFTGSAGPGFFTFVYYSFNAIVANHISELIPSGAISQTFWMMEAFSAMFLGLIFVSLMLSTRNKRQKEELDQAIEIISEKGRSVETFILDQYKFPSVDAALAELEKLKAGMVSFIYRISAGL